MKITFVNPSYEEPLVLRYLGLPSIPLGYSYVVAATEKAGYDVNVLDAFAFRWSTEKTISELQKTKPDVTAITCVTSNVEIAKEIAQAARKFSTVILGGTAVSLTPEYALDFCDYAVVGEGELTLPELLSATNPKEVKGLIYKKDGSIIRTEKREFIEDLDTLPFPARHLFPMQRYKQFGVMPFHTILSSRGCPNKCAYCTIGKLYPSWRGRSAQNVVDEMELLIKYYDCKGLPFLDEDFLISKERASQISEELLRRNLKVMWGIQTRATNITANDKPLLKLMNRAGCQFLLFGVESVKAETLKKMHRNVTLQTLRDAFSIAKDLGIRTAGSAILGFPGETKQDSLATIKFAKQLDPSYMFFGAATPFPGTQFHQYCDEIGAIKEKNLRKYTIMSPILETEQMSLKETGKLVNLAYKSFYFRPMYQIRRFLFEIKVLDWETIKGFIRWSLELSLNSMKFQRKHLKKSFYGNIIKEK